MKMNAAAAAATLLLAAATPALAQQYVYTEVAPETSSDALLFGFAAYKLCQVKTFLFAAVYILGAMAFVVFAIKSIFTKFEMKQFLPIIGALFVVATADLLLSFFSSQAFYCPTVLSSF